MDFNKMPLEYVLVKTVPNLCKSIQIMENKINLSIPSEKLQFIVTFMKLSSLMKYAFLSDIWSTDELITIKKYTSIAKKKQFYSILYVYVQLCIIND